MIVATGSAGPQTISQMGSAAVNLFTSNEGNIALAVLAVVGATVVLAVGRSLLSMAYHALAEIGGGVPDGSSAGASSSFDGWTTYTGVDGTVVHIDGTTGEGFGSTGDGERFLVDAEGRFTWVRNYD